MLQVLWYAVSVYLVFTVTISLFPAVISQVVSSAPTPTSSGWTSEFLHTLSLSYYNNYLYSHSLCLIRCLFLNPGVFPDVQCVRSHWSLHHSLGAGQQLQGVWSWWLPWLLPWEQVGSGQRSLLLMTGLRCLFIPAFLFCNVQVVPLRHHLPWQSGVFCR